MTPRLGFFLKIFNSTFSQAPFRIFPEFFHTLLGTEKEGIAFINKGRLGSVFLFKPIPSSYDSSADRIGITDVKKVQFVVNQSYRKLPGISFERLDSKKVGMIVGRKSQHYGFI